MAALASRPGFTGRNISYAVLYTDIAFVSNFPAVVQDNTCSLGSPYCISCSPLRCLQTGRQRGRPVRGLLDWWPVQASFFSPMGLATLSLARNELRASGSPTSETSFGSSVFFLPPVNLLRFPGFDVLESKPGLGCTIVVEVAVRDMMEDSTRADLDVMLRGFWRYFQASGGRAESFKRRPRDCEV